MATYPIGAVLAGSGEDPCCCSPEECCLYPWPDPNGIAGGPFYPETDLPEEVVIISNFFGPTPPYTLTKVTGEYIFSTPFGDGTIEIRAVTPGFSEEAWMWVFHYLDEGSDVYEPLSPFSFPCLINNDEWVTEDSFLDTYTATYGAFDPLEIPRVTLCLWQESGTTPPPGEVPYVMEVGYGIYPGEPYKWGAIVIIEGELPDYGVKDDPQSSPEGDYTMDSTVILTVAP